MSTAASISAQRSRAPSWAWWLGFVGCAVLVALLLLSAVWYFLPIVFPHYSRMQNVSFSIALRAAPRTTDIPPIPNLAQRFPNDWPIAIRWARCEWAPLDLRIKALNAVWWYAYTNHGRLECARTIYEMDPDPRFHTMIEVLYHYAHINNLVLKGMPEPLSEP